MLPRTHVVSIALGAVALAVAGCMHMPVMTLYKLATFDMMAADPADLRAAVRYPTALVARRDGVKLTLTVGPAKDPVHRLHTFILQEITAPQEREAVSRYGRAGHTVTAYRLSVEDARQVRLIQMLLREARKQGKSQGGHSLGVAAEACHRGGLPKGPILVSTYLRLDAADGYLPVVEDIDLRTQFDVEVLAKEVPPCSDGASAN